MRSYLDVEIEHGNNCQAGSEKIGFVESADFCNVSACQHTDAYPHIPRSEVGGSGRAPLTVGGKVYEQCVIGRKHDAEAYAKQQCHCKEHDVACHAVPLDDIDACREQEETEYHDVQSCRNYLRYFPLSTILPEKMREIAMPTAMKVKKKPVVAWIPISLAYMAT